MTDRQQASPTPEVPRSLPARPNLEFERKRAKKLVKTSDRSTTLALAQRQIAREYGFSSWRKLLEFYRTWERHDRAGPRFGWHSGTSGDRQVQQLLREFHDRQSQQLDYPDVYGTAAAFATFVPRFFGLPDRDVFASPVTTTEAQLVVARRARFSTWEEYQADSAASRARADERQKTAAQQGPHRSGPITLESFANGATDRERIVHLLEHSPGLRTRHDPTLPYDAQHDHHHWWLMLRALIADPAEPRDTRAWMESHDLALQPHLDHALLGHPLLGTTTDFIRGLLALGADPRHVSSNGYSVIEHALALYRNGDAVDLLRPLVSAPRRFWVAAGLGDVPTMLRFVDRRGVPSAAARRDRLDMTVFDGIKFTGGRPEASDHDILWEAFFIAGLNGRLEVLDALLARGFPVDYSPVWYNLLHIAVEQRNVPVVEFLLAHGANPDLKRYPDAMTAREMAGSVRASEPQEVRAVEIGRMMGGV
ncbi:MAG: ankyrin repeat domain-containing protein [Gemmatimonadaceae bacterium]|nr:ankyrin repeat domain-containing protein [Gemmatimonadaceae bacterium]